MYLKNAAGKFDLVAINRRPGQFTPINKVIEGANGQPGLREQARNIGANQQKKNLPHRVGVKKNNMKFVKKSVLKKSNKKHV